VHGKVEVKIIDIDLDRRRISLSRKQALKSAEPVEVSSGRADAPARETAELAGDEAEMELEAREASESVGVATEDTIARPEADDELVSAAEAAPEIAIETSAPEASGDPVAAAEAAPPEEKEQAEHTALLSPDSSPEGGEGLHPADPDRANIDVKLNREEPDPGAAPGENIEEIIDETRGTPEGQDEVADVQAAAEHAPAPSALEGEALEPGDTGAEESIESIVEDLKRERGSGR
jgi:hypothetical protein